MYFVNKSRDKSSLGAQKWVFQQASWDHSSHSSHPIGRSDTCHARVPWDIQDINHSELWSTEGLTKVSLGIRVFMCSVRCIFYGESFSNVKFKIETSGHLIFGRRPYCDGRAPRKCNHACPSVCPDHFETPKMEILKQNISKKDQVRHFGPRNNWSISAEE